MAHSYSLRDLRGRKSFGDFASGLFQIHQEKNRRRASHLFDVAIAPSLSEKRHSRKQDCNPLLDRWDIAGGTIDYHIEDSMIFK